MNIRSLDINTNVGLSDFLTLRWALIVVGLIIGGSVGLYEMFVGHILATSNVTVWTTPLITYWFLALSSTGISILLAYGMLAGNHKVTDHTRYLLVLDLALLIGGFIALATELGSILNMVNIILSPNPMSPIWWMGNFYSAKLVVVAIKLVRELMGVHGRVDRPLAWATLVISAAMTIGAAGWDGHRPPGLPGRVLRSADAVRRACLGLGLARDAAAQCRARRAYQRHYPTDCRGLRRLPAAQSDL